MNEQADSTGMKAVLVAMALATAAVLAGCDQTAAEARLEGDVNQTASAQGTKADANPTADAKAKPSANARPATTEGRAARFRDMAARQRAAERPAVPVATAKVRRGVVDAYFRGATNLTAAEEAAVVARTRGIVEAIFVEEGDAVRQNDPLAQLETERLALEVARSQTQLESLRAAYERATRMHDAKMISPNDFDTAHYNYEAEKANLAVREYELREATIRAPLDGVVTRRHVKVGHTLNPNEPAFEMKRLRNIEAILNVPEREIGRIRPGQHARVQVDALPEAPFAGSVARVAPEVDANSGTFRVTVSLDNDDGRLKPGMFVRVDVRVDRRENALLAPLEAVVALRDQSSLFVIEDGVAARRQVATGYVSDGNIEIVDGVAAGETIVASGQDGLREGAPVRVVASTP